MPSVNTISPIVIIPARLGAQRFPRKPLTLIKGVPMIVRVLQRAMAAQIGPVLVACCHQETKKVVEEAGGEAILTDPSLPSGSDRVMAALRMYDAQGRYQTVINLQGDLPTIDPYTLKCVVNLLNNETFDITTVAALMHDVADYSNPNIVKVVPGFDPQKQDSGSALYFSRAPIPYNSKVFAHHIGVYGFRRASLEAFVNAPPSYLETQEKLEQLRALELGMKVGVHMVPHTPLGVDSPADVSIVESYLRD